MSLAAQIFTDQQHAWIAGLLRLSVIAYTQTRGLAYLSQSSEQRQVDLLKFSSVQSGGRKWKCRLSEMMERLRISR